MIGTHGRQLLPSLTLLATSLALAACSTPGPVAPTDALAGRASQSTTGAAPRRPISGTSVSVATLDFNPPAGRCPASYPVLVNIDDTLQLAHLGRTHVVQSHCIDFTPGGAPDFVATRATFTAANGDLLYATYTGTIEPIFPASGPPTTASVAVQMTFSGGTGRFSDATGQLAGSGIQIFFGSATIVYDGWIAY